MRVLPGFVFAGSMILGLMLSCGKPALAGVGEPAEKAMLIGTWEMTKPSSLSSAGLKISISFRNDGTMQQRATLKGKTIVGDARYRLHKDGDKLKITTQPTDRSKSELTDTIESLTSDLLVTKSRSGASVEFRKVAR